MSFCTKQVEVAEGTKVLPPQNTPFGILILSWFFRNKRLRKKLSPFNYLKVHL